MFTSEREYFQFTVNAICSLSGLTIDETLDINQNQVELGLSLIYI